MAAFGSQNWTNERLNNHKSRIWRALHAGVKRFNRLTAEDRVAFNGRCTADVTNAFIIDELRKEFDGVPDSSFLPINNTTYHALNGCVLWYKQLGDDDLPSNIPTSTAEEMMQGQFEFMPDRLLVVVGFKPDALRQRLEKIEILRFGPSSRLEYVIEVLRVEVPAISFPAEKNRERRRTKVELRNGFEQKSLTAGNEPHD